MTERHLDPHLFVIMGATGDLMSRKLLPALYNLVVQGCLHKDCVILGSATTTDLDDKGFRARVHEAIAAAGLKNEAADKWCDTNIYYQPIIQRGREDYNALAERISSLERERSLPGNRVFYLALPPALFLKVAESLAQAGLNKSPGWTRLVIEKPFGRDLASAKALNDDLHRHFDESQIYRIDHYLGKETVQNLLVFRFANVLFESLWNRDKIESIEILVAEDLGVGKRARYYEQAGALRDIVQSHMTHLLTHIAMESPGSFDAEAIRQEKLKVLHSIAPIRPEDVVFGQYTRGQFNDQEVAGYHEEVGVASDSSTETFAALRLWVRNWRWEGVPFYLRTGKRLARRLTRIAIVFCQTPVCIFDPIKGCELQRNVLHITLQPDEGFSLSFNVKTPGTPLSVETEHLQFKYEEAFGPLPEAYETLLLDVITGDPTLFVHAEQTEASWALYSPLLQGQIPVYPYAAGTWGPAEAGNLIPHGSGITTI
jgi:glucose-6-phosphate 1-dehydrogenase